MGCEKDNESVWSKNTVNGHAISFFLPSQPSISLEVHIYRITGVNPLVYELLVVQDVNLLQPYEEGILPVDIDSVQIEYAGYNSETVTDRQVILQLVNMVNSLPVRPDYIILEPPGSETIFTLVFHSASQGYITVKSILGGENTGINIEGYPVLEDTHNLLRDKVEQILQS